MGRQRLFIRFGDLPESGRSGVWAPDGRRRGQERGVSAYAAAWDEREGLWAVDLPRVNDTTAQALIADAAAGHRRVLLLRGTQIRGCCGADGEPLVRGAAILREVSLSRIFVPGGVFHPRDLEPYAAPDLDDPREQAIMARIRQRWPGGPPPPWSREFEGAVAQIEAEVDAAAPRPRR